MFLSLNEKKVPPSNSTCPQPGTRVGWPICHGYTQLILWWVLMSDANNTNSEWYSYLIFWALTSVVDAASPVINLPSPLPVGVSTVTTASVHDIVGLHAFKHCMILINSQVSSNEIISFSITFIYFIHFPSLPNIEPSGCSILGWHSVNSNLSFFLELKRMHISSCLECWWHTGLVSVHLVTVHYSEVIGGTRNILLDQIYCTCSTCWRIIYRQ